MRIARFAAVAVVTAGLAACGGSPIPAEQAKLQGPPVLAPLGTGARWTYRITDPAKGVFDKQVVVLGPGPIPESTATGIEVRDTEPTNEETAWMDVESGFLVRHREEDRKAGTLVRVLPRFERPAGWLHVVTPAAKHVPRKVTAFRELVVEILGRRSAGAASGAGVPLTTTPPGARRGSRSCTPGPAGRA